MSAEEERRRGGAEARAASLSRARLFFGATGEEVEEVVGRAAAATR